MTLVALSVIELAFALTYQIILITKNYRDMDPWVIMTTFGLKNLSDFLAELVFLWNWTVSIEHIHEAMKAEQVRSKEVQIHGVYNVAGADQG